MNWDKTRCHCSKDNCRNGDDSLCCCHSHFAATSGFLSESALGCEGHDDKDHGRNNKIAASEDQKTDGRTN